MKAHIRNILLVSLALMITFSASAQKLKKSVTWENIKTHPAQLPVLGELKVVPSNLDAKSFWSVGSETLDRDYADFEKYKNLMKDTGVGYARLQSGWAKTEKKKGKYDFTWIDAHVDGLIEQGINPWMCLCYGNPIYSEQSGNNLGAKLFTDGPVMDAWLRYVKACVKRYKDKVTMWEIWNEPDGRHRELYDRYANLVVRTAKVIRKVDPDAKIAIFGACTPDREYIRQAMELIDKADGLKYVDYITYHAYWPLPEEIIPHVEKLREDVYAYDPSIGLLQGETGCPGQLEHGHAMKNIEWTEYSQVKWDLRQALTHFGLGIPYSFFTMVDLNYGWMLQSYGLVRMNSAKEPVYKRPKYYAVQHVTNIFTPDMKATDQVKVIGLDGLKLSSYGLQKDGKNVGCMLWISSSRPTSSLDRVQTDIDVAGMQFEDPVYVDVLTGLVHDIKDLIEKKEGDSVTFKDLPIWDCPVVILEKSAVNYKGI